MKLAQVLLIILTLAWVALLPWLIYRIAQLLWTG